METETRITGWKSRAWKSGPQQHMSLNLASESNWRRLNWIAFKSSHKINHWWCAVYENLCYSFAHNHRSSHLDTFYSGENTHLILTHSSHPWTPVPFLIDVSTFSTETLRHELISSILIVWACIAFTDERWFTDTETGNPVLFSQNRSRLRSASYSVLLFFNTTLLTLSSIKFRWLWSRRCP